MKLLAARGHRLHVLSRHAGTNLPAGVQLSVWDPLLGPAPEDALLDADAVLHLAGEPVAQRWTAAAKQRIRDSRVVRTGAVSRIRRLQTLWRFAWTTAA